MLGEDSGNSRTVIAQRKHSSDRRGEGDDVPVTVLGTGIVGQGVATSLLRTCQPWTVIGHADQLRAKGSTVATTPDAAVADTEDVLTPLFGADAVFEMVTAASTRRPSSSIRCNWAPSAGTAPPEPRNSPSTITCRS